MGVGLEAISNALTGIATCISSICITGIIAITFLVYTNKISFNDVKDLFKKDKDKRYK